MAGFVTIEFRFWEESQRHFFFSIHFFFSLAPSPIPPPKIPVLLFLLSLYFAFLFSSIWRGRIRFSEAVMDVCLAVRTWKSSTKDCLGSCLALGLGCLLVHYPVVGCYRSVAVPSWTGLGAHSISHKGLLDGSNHEFWPSLLVHSPSFWT